MAKPELGTKRVCPSCGTKYYDLHRNPIACPNCGAIFEIVASPRAAAARAVAPAPVEEAADEMIVDRDPNVVSLEEAEEESEAEAAPDLDEDEAAIPDADLDVDAAIETEDEEAPFLDEEAEEGDSVADLLEVDGEEEDEV